MRLELIQQRFSHLLRIESSVKNTIDLSNRSYLLNTLCKYASQFFFLVHAGIAIHFNLIQIFQGHFCIFFFFKNPINGFKHAGSDIIVARSFFIEMGTSSRFIARNLLLMYFSVFPVLSASCFTETDLGKLS